MSNWIKNKIQIYDAYRKYTLDSKTQIDEK